MNNRKPNPDMKSHAEKKHLPTEREFKRLLKRDEDVESGVTLANYSVYHKYSRGS